MIMKPDRNQAWNQTEAASTGIGHGETSPTLYHACLLVVPPGHLGIGFFGVDERSIVTIKMLNGGLGAVA
jgi:hypothetical protein